MLSFRRTSTAFALGLVAASSLVFMSTAGCGDLSGLLEGLLGDLGALDSTECVDDPNDPNADPNACEDDPNDDPNDGDPNSGDPNDDPNDA
ncbi:MAG: hypothetical protein ACKVS9_09525 [Phycisphaerae bacterium]